MRGRRVFSGSPMSIIIILACLAATARPVAADVRLPAIIGDNMVLQQQVEVPLWGWASPGEEIRIEAGWRNEVVTTTTGRDGKWMARLETPGAGGPYEITISGKTAITLRNVLIGEVWICSGQSNMEWTMNNTRGHYADAAAFEAELEAADRPRIRLFNVERAYSPAPQEDCTGSWVQCKGETVLPFSAVGYHFARFLQEEIDVPIGLIGTNWGGTLCEAWTSEDTLREWPFFAPALEVAEIMRADPVRVKQMHATEVEKWWEGLEKKDPGSAGGWMNVDADDSDWKTMELPGPWEQGGVGNVDGIVWFRKTIDVPAAWVGRELVLELGPIDDMDTTWFNGVPIGGLENINQWNVPRKYDVPGELVKAGANVIAVRVVDTGGAGGMCGEAGQMILSTRGDDARAKPIALAGEWRYKRGAGFRRLGRWPQAQLFHHNAPTALFNGMIAPLLPYGIRGAIWYQGESNRSRAYQYRELFPAMIADWRAHWGQGDFPFYFVQIAPFNYGGDTGQTAELREAQGMAMAAPNTGMAVTMDIGNLRDIHPRNKVDVGRRLALWALAETYDQPNIVCSGPIYKSMKIEGDSIRLFFDHVGGGLMAKGGKLTHFQIAGADRKFVEAKAVIDGETIVVSGEGVADPVAVRYGWSATAEPNLFNAAGLPAAPFRTDDWPGVTEGEGRKR